MVRLRVAKDVDLLALWSLLVIGTVIDLWLAVKVVQVLRAVFVAMGGGQ